MLWHSPFLGGTSLKQLRLEFYTIDMKYIRSLAKADDNVLSISPQIGKSTRPFVGLVVVFDKIQYCIPLSSPKPKHYKMKNDIDFSKIFDPDNVLIGVLNFNNMIHVNNVVITKLDLKIHDKDSLSTKQYKKLATNQLNYCRQNQNSIISKAIKLYTLITKGKPNISLKKRCCNFLKLEEILNRYTTINDGETIFN